MRSPVRTVKGGMTRYTTLHTTAGVGVLLTLSLLLNGCMTIASRIVDFDEPLTSDPNTDLQRTRIYSGTREDFRIISKHADAAQILGYDLFLSFVADTILLPLTIYEQFVAGQLQKAASRGDVDAVNAMLDKGTDINETYDHRRTALMYSAWNGHIAVVQLLLDKGADVNTRDQFGNTALTIATRRGHTEVVQLLMNAGAKSGDTEVR